VAVITRAGIGEMSDYLVNRTKRGRPGSPPTRLNVSLTGERGRSADVFWGPPDVPNAPIDFYDGFYAYEDFMGRLQGDSFMVEDTQTHLTALEAFANYNIRVRACTRIPESPNPLCGEDWVSTGFRTGIGGMLI
jgi:hypothetical protein